jgi:hypothetical protein
MVAVAIGGAAILGAGAQIIGANSAADAQRSAANTASQTQRDIYAQNQQLLNPYVQGGLGAYSTLNNLLGVGGNSATMQSTLEGLPGYQFTRDQGLKSVQNSAAGRGLGTSGAALKGAANYATGLASSKYGEYAGLLQNSATTGMQAGSSIAGVGQATGANIGSAQMGAGNAIAAGYNAMGSGIAGGLNGAAGAYTLNSLFGQGGGGFGGGGLAYDPSNIAVFGGG